MCPSIPNVFCGHDQTRFVSESINDQRTTSLCGACQTFVTGPRLRCTICNFTIHPICRARRPTLSTFLHPQHPLTLVTAPTPVNRCCDICLEVVGGVYYTCCSSGCDFDVHPQCSQISQRVHHVLDAHHTLELQHRPPYSTRCNVCGGDCAGWAYRCGGCHVDIHYWCLWKPHAVVATPQDDTRQPFYFGLSHGSRNNSVVPYWWPWNYSATTSYHNSSGVGSRSGFGLGSGLSVPSNITGSLAVRDFALELSLEFDSEVLILIRD